MVAYFFLLLPFGPSLASVDWGALWALKVDGIMLKDNRKLLEFLIAVIASSGGIQVKLR